MAAWLRCFLALSLPCGAAMADGQLTTGQRAIDRVGSISLARIGDLASAPDPELAAVRLAAERGDAYAQTMLGEKCYLGEGVPRDQAEALKWFKLAALQGDADAQAKVGAMCFLGEGVAKDTFEAAKWFRLASGQGNATAQGCLGMMYAMGDGVPRDLVQAYAWLLQATRAGNTQVALTLERLRRGLAPEQIEEGRKRAQAAR